MNLEELKPRNALFGALLVIGLLIFAVGCGDGRPTRVPVSGKVTIDGKPLEYGSIAFLASSGGRPGGSSLGKDGSYAVTMYTSKDGLIPGKYKVTVSGVDWFSDKAGRWHAPKRYKDPETSGLTKEITVETDQLNIDLTWEGDEHSEPWVEKSR